MADLIDRQAAIAYAISGRTREFEGEKWIRVSEVRESIQTMTSAQPERKTGRWTDDNACPFCGFHPWFERDIHTLSFCPNCGAAMDATENENPALSVKVVPLPTNRR